MHFHAALYIHHNERLCYITFKYQLTIYKKRTNYSQCRHHVLVLQEKQCYSFLGKGTHPLYILFPEEIPMLLMLFKSNATNSSSWISSVIESLVSFSVTKFRCTSLLQNSHFFNYSCIS